MTADMAMSELGWPPAAYNQNLNDCMNSVIKKAKKHLERKSYQSQIVPDCWSRLLNNNALKKSSC